MAESLFVTQDYPPGSGGIGRFCFELSSRFPAGAVEVFTVSAGNDDQGVRTSEDRRQPPKLHRMPFTLGEAHRFSNVIRWARRVNRRVAEKHINVVQVGSIRPVGYMAAWLRAQRGIPYVVYLYGRDVLKERRNAARSRRSWWTSRWIFSNASTLIAISRATADLAREHLEELKIDPAGRIRIVHPGTNTDQFRPDAPGAESWRQRLDACDRPLLLSVCRLVPRKGVDHTLEAMARLGSREPAPVYAIAGTGPDHPRLERRAGELGLSDRVTFLGRVSDADLPGLYAAADLFVLPTREIPEDDEVEGFGIVYCEAQAAGLPVLAARSGGVPDAVRDGEVGRLVPPHDLDALTDALSTFLNDSDLRDRMGRAGRRAAVTYFNWCRAADDAWQIVEDATAISPVHGGTGPDSGGNRAQRTTDGLAVLHLDGGRRWGGGQNQIRLLMRQLANYGIRQLCLCPRGSPLEARLRQEVLPVRGVSWRGGMDIRAASAIFRTVSEFDIIHCHDAHALQLAILPVRLRRIPLVASRRVTFKARPVKWNRADCVIAISDVVRTALRRDGIGENRIRVIPSGVDAAEIAGLSALEPSLRKRLRLGPDSFLVGMIGRLDAGKGQRMIPDAVSYESAPIHWVLVGNGPDAEILERSAAALGVESRVHLVGALPDARESIAELDLFVFTSASDGLGTSILDAMAAGVPVLGADAAGAAEILRPVHGRTGATLFPPDDSATLAARVHALFENPYLRRELVAAQYERLRDYTMASTVERTLAVYRELLDADSERSLANVARGPAAGVRGSDAVAAGDPR